MTPSYFQALAILLGLAFSLANAATDIKPLSTSAMLPSGTGLPRPAVELPDYVPAPQGQVTFWADFAHPSADRLPLYLVNRTETLQSFSSQDRDLYIKLEFKNPAGKWTRAQAHLSSWCGNSYFPVELPPGQFLVLYGYRPKGGNQQTVRYASRINTELISNEGTGLISETDVQNASKDSITESQIPRAIRSSLELRDPREDQLLKRNRDWLEAAAAMRLLKVMERNEVALDWVKNLKQILNSLPTSVDVTEAQTAANEVLTYAWPTEIKSDALFNRCIEAIAVAESDPPKIGTLESEPKLLWSLLAGMFGENAPSQSRAQAMKYDLTKMRPVLMAAAKQVIGDPTEKGSPAASVLDCGVVADQVIPHSQYEEWLLHPHSLIQQIAARGLARRMQWKLLSELGMKLTPKGQLIVLETLAFSGHERFRGQDFIREPEIPEEYGFWIHCMKMQPLGTVDALWTDDRGEPKRPLNKVLHDPLRDYLKQEAERAAKISTYYDLGPHGSKLYLAVQMLGSWKLKEDIPIFKLLLKHPGYYDYNGCAIQKAARAALALQGEASDSL